jgi:competence protein ComGF
MKIISKSLLIFIIVILLFSYVTYQYHDSQLYKNTVCKIYEIPVVCEKINFQVANSIDVGISIINNSNITQDDATIIFDWGQNGK